MDGNKTELFDNQSKTELIETTDNHKLFDGKELTIGSSLQGEKYTIERIIGAGGFGITYLIRHNALGHLFAVKEFFIGGSCVRNTINNRTILLQGIDSGTYDKYLQKFIEEAQTLVRLDHPNIVKVTDIFCENNTAYMVMNFVEGDTLQRRVERNGRLSYEAAKNYITQLVEAATYLHRLDILHRDIKPENIILTSDNKVVLIDFGSAREFVHDKTQSHTSILTHGYAPLEQYSASSKKGAYTDIYSLGAVFYYMLTGQKPMDAATRTMETMPEANKLVPEIPAFANHIILKAMELKPEKRYQSAEEFLVELSGKTTRTSKFSNKTSNKPTNYIDKKQTLSIYYNIVYLIVLLGTAFGISFGISKNIEIFPLFTLPLVFISLIFLFRDYGTKESMKILKQLNYVWIAIPIVFYFIIWWLWLWNDFEGINKLLDFKFFYFIDGALRIYNPELLLPIFIYICLYSFFAVGRQINIINNYKNSILQRIQIITIFLLINIFLGVLITLFFTISILILVFILKPHYLQYVMPAIGLFLALILLALSFIKKIKQYSLYYIVSTIITVILCVLIWQKEKVYNYISEYSEGFAIVKNDQTFNYDIKDYRSITKFGFINKQGKEVVPLKYDEVRPFTNGFAIVAVSPVYADYGYKKYGFIDKTGKEITEIKYDEVKPFSEGFAIVAVGYVSNYYNDRLYGFIDDRGKEITPLKFKRANSFNNGRAKVTVEENGSYYGSKIKMTYNYELGEYEYKSSINDYPTYYKWDRELYIDTNGNEIK